jgi:hypothetical protein
MVVGSTQAAYARNPIAQQEKDSIETAVSLKTWEKSWDKVSLNAFGFWKKDKALAVGPKGIMIELELPMMTK